MKRQSFYRRDPGLALAGMSGMTLEERGVYNTVIDLLYLTWRPLEDNRAYIAAHCGCAVQKLNPIIAVLIDTGKLIRFEEDGRIYLSNRMFEEERLSVKGAAPTRSGRGEVGGCQGEVGEKSAGVRENPPTCGDEPMLFQLVTSLDREEREEKIKEAKASVEKPSTKPMDAEFEEAWKTYPHFKGRSASRQICLEAWRRAADKAGGGAALLAAIRVYATEDRQHRGECGAPAFERWLKWGRYEAWLTAGTAAASMPAANADGQDRWRFACRRFTKSRYWDTIEHGPAPGRTGCVVPLGVLVEFSLGATGAAA